MSETKWKSQLFSEHNTKNNKNILTFNMNNKIKNIKKNNNKNIDNIESFKTINDNDNDNISIDGNENIKEGMFSKGEFTGYDWDDPVHLGRFSGKDASFGNSIQEIYDKSVAFITYTSSGFLKLSGEKIPDKTLPDDHDTVKKYNDNLKIVRKYVATCFCLITAYFSTYNMYFASTYKNPIDKRRSIIIEFLTEQKTESGKFHGLADIIHDKSNSNSMKGILYSIFYFFFEYVLKIYDDFNVTFLDVIPTYISSNFGKIFTFIAIFIFLFNAFYYGAEQTKDLFISLTTGTGFGAIQALLIIYVILIIGASMLSKDPNKHSFSDWEWVMNAATQAGGAGALIIGFFVCINLIRALVVGSITLLWVPIIIGLSIIFYSFFSILFLGDSISPSGFFKTIRDIDNDCVNDYKVKFNDVCDQYTIYDWIKFFILTLFKFIFDSILETSLLLSLITGVFDFYSNINGSIVKHNLLAYASVVILILLTVLFSKLASVTNSNLKDAGFLEINKTDFEFDQVKLEQNNDDLLYSINKQVKELQELQKLNKTDIKTLF